MEALARAGQPVVRIALADRWQLGQAFFLWEMATAVAGSILGINPFDQPDVEASKAKTRELTDAYAASGSLPAEAPSLTEDRKSTRLNSSHANISYAVFCLKKKKRSS